MSNFMEHINNFLGITQGQVPVELVNYGHFVKQYDNSGFIGGVLQKTSTSIEGAVRSETVTMSSILGCGHLVNSIEQISGYCQVCGRLCCNNYSCLAVCEITGITVCRRHYVEKHGIIVSSFAQKGLWKLKAKKIAENKRLIHDGKLFTENNRSITKRK